MTESVVAAPVAGADGSTGEPAADPTSPRCRLAELLDEGTVDALHAQDASGVLAVSGLIGRRPVVAFATDRTVMGGAMGAEGCRHIVTAIDTAVGAGCPVIGLWHSGGARLAEGVQSLDAVGAVFAAMVRASGTVPQISVVLGPAAGGAAYGPALTDVVIMAPAGRVFVTGPDVVRTVTGERIDAEGLGGPETHGRHSGVAHVVASSESDALERARLLVDLLARPGRFHLTEDDLHLTGVEELLPLARRRAYDVRPLLVRLLDAHPDGGGSALTELQPDYAPNVVVGWGRLGGRTVGVIANNPLHLGGCLDSRSAEKAARFVRTCDAFGTPMLVVVDVPGYLPGVGQEWEGVVRRGAKLLHAFAEASVSRVTLVTRKSFGGAYIAMNSRSLGASAVLAWPDAEVAVMNATAAVDILHRRTLAATPDADREAVHAQLIEAHERTVGGVDRAVALGVVDEVIEPATTRWHLIRAFDEQPGRRGRHKNIPL